MIRLGRALLTAAYAGAVLAVGCGEDDSAPTAPAERPTVNSATSDNFDAVVLEQSRARPVVVMFTARWSGPDRVLAPTAREAVAARDGRVQLTMLDVDAASDVAGRFGIESVPTLLPFSDGRPVGEPLVGAVPRRQIDRFLDRVEQEAKN